MLGYCSLAEYYTEKYAINKNDFLSFVEEKPDEN